MVKNCCVKGCKSFWYPNTNLSFFRFPFKRREVLDKWLQIVPSRGSVCKNTYICSQHFKQSDFENIGLRCTLKKSAVPRVFANNESISVPTTSDDVALVSRTEHENIDTEKSNDTPTSLEPDVTAPQSEVPTTSNDAALVSRTGRENIDTEKSNDTPTSLEPDVTAPQSEVPTTSNDAALVSQIEHENTDTEKLNDTSTSLEPDVTAPQSEVPTTSNDAALVSRTEHENIDTEKLNDTSTSLEPDVTAPKSKIISGTSNYVVMPKEREDAMRRQIFLLQKENRRLQRKYRNMTELLRSFQKQGECTKELEKVLLRKMSSFDVELFKNEVRNSNIPKNGRRYSDKMKEFAITVYFYSPEAYKFLRTLLHLPDESVLRKMLIETDVTDT